MRGLELIDEKRKYQRLRKTCWTIFFSLLAIIVLALTIMYLLSKGPKPGEKLMVRSLPHVFTSPGATSPVTLTLYPEGFTSQPPPDGRRLDILIGIDNSLSMTIDEGSGESALERVRKVAKSFITTTNLEKHQIGLVTLDSNAQVIHPLSQNAEPLLRAIDELEKGSSTQLDQGLFIMRQEFGSSRRRANTLAVAILLSDGRSNNKSASDQAQRLKADGMTFIAPIGIGDNVDDNLMKTLASFKSRYGKGISVEELTAIYSTMLDDLEQLLAIDITVTERYNDKAHKLIRPGAGQTGGQLGQGVADPWQGPEIKGDTLVWQRGYLTARKDEDLDVGYQIQPKGIGWFFADKPGATLQATPIGAAPFTRELHRKPKLIAIPFWLWFLVCLLLFLILLPWLLAWWRRYLAARGPALIPPALDHPELFPLPAKLPALDLEKLIKPTLPTLIVGLGGTGRWVLTYLKKAVLEANCGHMPKTVSFLLIDTHERELQGQAASTVTVGDVTLAPEECLIVHEDLNHPQHLPDRLRKMVTDPEAEGHLKNWWPADAYSDLTEEQFRISLSTNSRRAFGKLALYLDLERGSQESRLGLKLDEVLTKLTALDKGDPVVFIAASLAGGTGSGMLSDVAQLIRRIARNSDTRAVTVNGLIALQNAFSGQLDSLGLARANTFAGLRELDRFLATRDDKINMTYCSDPGDQLNGPLMAPLFDGCFVFDADRNPFTLLRERPEHGVFPSMADAVQAFLYTAPGGDFDQEIKQHRAVHEFEKESGGHGIVSSFGTYVIRLPIYEFLQTFKYRFAKEFLLRHFEAEETSSGYRPKTLDANELSAVNDALQAFLTREGPERTPVDVLQAASQLDAEMLTVIVEADRGHKLPDDYVAAHKANFQKYLAEHFMAWANFSERDVAEGTAKPKFMHAYYLLCNLQQQFDTLAKQTEYGGGIYGEARYRDIADNLVNAYREVLVEAKKQMDGYLKAILGFAGKEEERLRGQDSVVSLLADHEREQLANRRLDKAILVREYLYDAKLEEELYRRFLGPQTAAKQQHRLVWHAREENGGLTFSLVLVTDQSMPLSPDPGHSSLNCNQAITLPQLLAQPMWEMDITPYLQNAYPRGEDLSNKIYEHAAPMITFSKNQAVRHSSKFFINLHESPYLEEVMTHLLPNFPQKRHVRRTDSMDNHAFAALTVLDSLPLPSLRPYRQACEDYLDIPDSQRPQLHVFGAEQYAALLERNLPQIQEPKRVFHPRFIALLAHPHKARLFARSAIYGLIAGFPKFQDRDFALAISEKGRTTHYQLNRTLAGMQARPLMPYFDAMTTFIAGRSLDEPGRDIPYREIEAAIATLRSETRLDALEKHALAFAEVKTGLEGDDIQKDVVSYIHLMLHEEIKQKQYDLSNRS